MNAPSFQGDRLGYLVIGHGMVVLLIGLASKNAILIVEFARELRRQGVSALDAAVEAARLRLRPILMTSLAFVLGMAPLLVATGAGAASRRALGTTVFGGMIAATFLTALFVPAFARLAFARESEGAEPADDPNHGEPQEVRS